METQYVNTSSTQASLILDAENGEASFSGTVSGNIHLVKRGIGKIKLTQANSHTGGTSVEGGILSINSESALGGATDVHLTQEGCVYFEGISENPFQLNKHYRINGTGCVGVAQGLQVNIGPELGTDNFGQTLVKTGLGTLYISGPVGVCNVDTRWIIKEGDICQYGASLFGGHADTTEKLVLDIREGATYRMISDTHSPIGKLVLTGGTLDVSNLGNYGQWGNTAFRGGVEVHPSEIPSRIKVGKFIHLNHLNPDCVFNVDQGATLFVDGPLVDGYEKDSWKLIHCRLIKRGAGTLVLNGKNTFSGGLVLEAGTIKTGNRLALGTAPCDIRENSTLLVPAMAEASLPGLTENSVLTQTGDGVLCFDGNLPSAAQVNISEGIAEFPSLDTIPSFVFFSPSTFLALQDFQQNWQSAMTAYPNIAGVLSAQKNVTVDQIAFDPQKEHWAVGALEDCTLEIGSVSGIQNLDVVGTGITKIGSLSGTDAVTVKKGAFAYLPENSPISSAGGRISLPERICQCGGPNCEIDGRPLCFLCS